MQAGVAHVGESLEALVVGAGGDDGGVELAGGVDVVVVGGEAGVLEGAGLGGVDHAEGDTGLEAEGAHAGDHLDDVAQAVAAAAHVAPRRAHAEARAALVARRPRRRPRRRSAPGAVCARRRPLPPFGCPRAGTPDAAGARGRPMSDGPGPRWAVARRREPPAGWTSRHRWGR